MFDVVVAAAYLLNVGPLWLECGGVAGLSSIGLIRFA